MPLVFVNREAHGIAMDWVTKSPLRTCVEEKREERGDGDLVFLRPFLLDRDVLFVREGEWDTLFTDHFDTAFEKYEGRMMDVSFFITRIALPRAFFVQRDDAGGSLADLFHLDFSIREVYILVGNGNGGNSDGSGDGDGDGVPSDSDLFMAHSTGRYQRLWEIEHSHKVASWAGGRTHGDWDLDFTYPEWEGDDSRQIVQNATQGLRKGLLDWNVTQFDMFLCSCVLDPEL